VIIILTHQETQTDTEKWKLNTKNGEPN